MKDYHRPATLDDAHFVAHHLRPADRLEVMAVTGLPAFAVLPEAVRRGGVEAMIAPTGEVVGLCGVDPSAIDGFGNVWMIGTPRISAFRHEFLRAAREWLARRHREYPRLGNLVDARNTVHIRWLALLGFRFTHVVSQYGAGGLPFIQFERSA